MSERIQIRMDKEMFDYIELYRVENKLDDNPNAIREIIRLNMKKQNSLLNKLKNLF